MAVIALGSVAGSPGVTRLTIGLAGAWPDQRRRIVVEADPETWLLLATGAEPWAQALAEGRLRVSGTRAHLDDLLPLSDADPAEVAR